MDQVEVSQPTLRAPGVAAKRADEGTEASENLETLSCSGYSLCGGKAFHLGCLCLSEEVNAGSSFCRGPRRSQKPGAQGFAQERVAHVRTKNQRCQAFHWFAPPGDGKTGRCQERPSAGGRGSQSIPSPGVHYTQHRPPVPGLPPEESAPYLTWLLE